ncbi:sterol glucosyltransferase [Colletotrichum karsti]|uniref:Sterol glucosyltransferase n=1 Tax=Colletotrichum karsti TaxID=1095194 RepID=A0A9P6I9Z3_9PEZI|nr:sterol glucosyltransferase [Colletotrichum karsti]KAF9874750.1 sterol glucosyltransferase [Colletotrichum karsti]
MSILKSKRNLSVDTTESLSDIPPPYELHSSGPLLSSEAAISPDGHVTINFQSENPQQLAEELPPFPTADDATALVLNDKTVPPLNIVIQVVGSRGDVQPFIAYGTALRRYGHRVRLATHDTFDKFVRDSGLEFFPIGGDPADLMSYMVRNPGLIPSMESLRGGDVGRKRRMMREMLRGCWKSCIDPDPVTKQPFVADAIIANPPSFAHVHCAQALGIPAHIMFTMPWTATRAFPHPLANIQRGDNLEPATTNWLSYGVVELMTWQGLGDVINSWRRKELELEPVPASMGPGITTFLKIPHTYCWSPAVVPKPADWGPEIDVCGFFMRDEPSFKPPADLDAFLTAGPPPLYVGFGSIVVDDPARLTEIILEASKACNTRVIISRGWSKLGEGQPNSENVFYLGDCPHEWLFKRVSAVVHHGGAGTTACGLINARPTIIVPFFGDQPFWGRVVANAGAGPLPIPQKELTVERLSTAIQFCLSPEANQAVSRVADVMRQERGVDAAVASFHRNIPATSLTCDFLPDQPAAWTYETKSKSGRKHLKISNQAASYLIEAKKLKANDLKPLRTREYNTDVKRWDPITGGASSLLGIVTDFTFALGGTFIDPWKEYKRARASGREAGRASGAAAMAVGKGIASMTGVVAKGGLVNMPLALADGLHNVPKLLGGQPRDNGKVEDWKSGGVVAAKTFGTGFYDGITGVFVDPYKGAKEGGALGLARGVGTGSLGLITKPGAGLFGLVGYPAQGIHKSLKASMGRNRAVWESKSRLLDHDRQRQVGDAPRARSKVLQVFDAYFTQ